MEYTDAPIAAPTEGDKRGSLPIAPIVQGLFSAGSNMYSGKQQAKAMDRATQSQTEANKAAMAYTSQKDYDAALAAEAAQRGNYDIWKAGQQTSNDLLQAREQRLQSLGSLIGAGNRMPITTDIPDYVPSPRPRRPQGGDRLRDYLA